MRARLSSGEIITLAKDCTCPTHEGPHWLHEDALERAKASEALQSRDIFRHIFTERARLETKVWNMNRCGITELMPDEQDACQ